MGINAVCTVVSGHEDQHRVVVLLPGERIYTATGSGGESCDTLAQFAHPAIPTVPG